MRRPGRRGGDTDSRSEILTAARAEFTEHGYNAATIRAIARRAGVDPALVYHFFTDKPALYAATLQLPADPRTIHDEVRASGRPQGAVLAERFLAQWESGPGAPGQAFVTVAQATSSSPEIARSVREYLMDRVWASLADRPDDDWRRTMVASVLLGMAWNRYVLRTEPIAAASRGDVARWFGPLLDSITAEP